MTQKRERKKLECAPNDEQEVARQSRNGNELPEQAEACTKAKGRNSDTLCGINVPGSIM